VILVLLSICYCFAHIRWVFPSPRSITAFKTYPCGNDPFWVYGQNITTISPGILTVHWEEFVYHQATPFRIAISVGDDSNYDNWILVDHLPHMNYTGGFGQFYYNITIPNINFPKCGLQLINPMTDKIPQGSCCSYPEEKYDPLCNSVYHSCANIRITGTEDPSTFQFVNNQIKGSYKRESTTWQSFGPNSFTLSGSYNVTYNPSTCLADYATSSNDRSRVGVGIIVGLLLIIPCIVLGGVAFYYLVWKRKFSAKRRFEKMEMEDSFPENTVE